jgi:hypothetical protein
MTQGPKVRFASKTQNMHIALAIAVDLNKERGKIVVQENTIIRVTPLKIKKKNSKLK